MGRAGGRSSWQHSARVAAQSPMTLTVTRGLLGRQNQLVDPVFEVLPVGTDGFGPGGVAGLGPGSAFYHL